MPRATRPNTLILLLLSGSAFALTACGGGTPDSAASAAKEGAASGATGARGNAVTVATLETRTFAPKISLSGEVRARNEAAVFAQTSGVRITALMADVGDTVRAGQALARLDVAATGAEAALARAQVVQAQASLRESEISLRQSRSELARAQSLGGEAVLSAEAIEQRKSAADTAQARLEVAKASLAVAQAQAAQTAARQTGGVVTSPVSGLIIARSARVGEQAGAGGEPMFRIVSGGALEVGAQVSEADINTLRVGQQARFRLPDGATVTATLSRAPAAVDTATRSGFARFDLAPDARLKAGMFLDGEADLPARQTLAIPATALVFGRDGPFVFVVEAGNKVRKQLVRTGRREGAFVEILTGPPAGSRIVVGGAAFLADGDAVVPSPMKAATPPAAAPAPAQAPAPAAPKGN